MALLSLFDPLYCQEDNLELDDYQSRPMPPNSDSADHLFIIAAVAEDGWTEVLRSLSAKAPETSSGVVAGCDEAGRYLQSARTVSVQWVLRTAGLHNFSALTALLAVNYLDRCFLGGGGVGGLKLQGDKPWMGRLAALACLSLAAKVEETRVPPAVDLQFVAPPSSPELNAYVFESKTIRRMELLVLSALGWRMNPVTPLSFIDHLALRLCSKDFDDNGGGTGVLAYCIADLVRSCEDALISVVADSRWLQYPALIWTAAALLYAVSSTTMDANEVHQTVALLNAPTEKVQECHQIMLECINFCDAYNGRKRKRSCCSLYNFNHSSPRSPSGVIGSCFSCEISCDSYTMWPSSVSSSLAIRPTKLQCFANNNSFIDEER